ncbi:MAG: riboflavin biosynthesis protein RibF [Ruminococcus sp.]|nr:riboflavin biosynthesis protein RibF [Ruminococcus sp.]
MAEKTSAALGLFDGVHIGHRRVLELALKNAENGLVPAVFTFEPDTVLKKPTGCDGYIYTAAEKLRILKNLGFNEIYSPSFSHICGMSGEEFARDILAKELNVAAVCCGNNFRFGKNASCGTEELRKFGKKYGFDVFVAEDASLEGTVVSSGEIRRLLLNGNIALANRLLGAPYAVSAEVVKGAALGRTIGFPTANQLFADNQLVVKFGVYRAETVIDGITYQAMTNIGIKPTVDYGGKPLAETFISGFSGDIYGRMIQVQLLEFMRPEKKFGSVDELKAQIADDLKKSIR